MATALDSSFAWAVNPKNIGALSPQQAMGLASLVPLAGAPGVAPAGAPSGFSSQVSDYNKKVQDIEGQITAAQAGWNQNHFGGQTKEQFQEYMDNLQQQLKTLPGPFAFAAQGSGATEKAPTPNLDSATPPNFDPNYPVESMVALRNYLGKTLPETMNERGILNSGVGGGMAQQLSKVAPNVTPEQAQQMDFEKLTGAKLTPGQPDVRLNPSEDPSQPAFAIYDPNSGSSYGSPGYFYDPTRRPNMSRMPWLTNATSPTSPTA